MRKDNVLHVLTEDLPENASQSATTRFMADDRKARAHVVLNLGEEPATLITSLLMADASTKEVWKKLTDSYQKENIQTKLNLRNRLHNIRFKDTDDLQEHLTSLEEIFLDLARLNDAVADGDKTGILLRSLPESLGFIALMADAQKMDYDSICALLKSEMERRKSYTKPPKDDKASTEPVPAARQADAPPPPHPTSTKLDRSNVECWYCHKRGHTRGECRLRKRHEGINKRNRGRGGGYHHGGRGRGRGRGRGNHGGNNNRRNSGYQGHNRRNQHHQHNDEMDWEYGNGSTNQQQPRGFFTKLLSFKSNTQANKSDQTWLDCGANNNFVWDRSVFVTYKETPVQHVETCNGTSEMVGEGDVKFLLGEKVITLKCKHTPGFNENVIALSKFVRLYQVEFKSTDSFEGCEVKDNGKLVHTIKLTNGLYPFPKPLPATIQTAMSVKVNQYGKWHSILGHIGQSRMLKAIHLADGISGVDVSASKDHQCIPCLEFAKKRAPIPTPVPRQTKPLQLTHTDISGKISYESFGGYVYFAVFLDDNTARSAVYFLRQRSELLAALQQYKALVENELPFRMLEVRLDKAGEHCSDLVTAFVRHNGLKMEYSPAYASQSNGASERLIQELWKVARTMLYEAKLDIKLWAEAISHANWLRNRLPAQRVNLRIPYTLWTGARPDFSVVLQFGQPGYAFQYRSDTARAKKFLPRSVFGHFVGMASEHSLYRIFLPVSKSIYVCRRGDFTPLKKETELPSFSTLMENVSRHREIAEVEEEEEPDAEEVQSKAYFAHYSQIPLSLKAAKKDKRIPKSFNDACTIPNWAQAIDREYNALVARDTWEYVERTPNMKPLPFIWDFRIKDTAGSLANVLCKARCCLRGDQQIAYRDFDPDNLYAPVVRHETIRVFIVKSSAQGLIVEGADVDNAYLYGDIEDGTIIIMEQPTNSSGIPARPGFVCRLRKSIYGLRQAGYIWGTVIHAKFIEWGFEQSNQDQRLYFYRQGNKFINLILVVDDMAFSSNDRELLEWFKGMLTDTFKVKLLGTLQMFIGWEIIHSRHGIYLGQQKYVKRFLTDNDMLHVKPADTPLPSKCNLNTATEKDETLSPEDHRRYRSLIGGLAYLAICTRPDIAFAVSTLSRQLHAPAKRHLILAKRVVRYIAGTADKKIFYPRSTGASEPLMAYADADWAGCHDTRRSTTGILIKINNAPVYWASKRQSLVTLSSAEAEYVSLSQCGKQIINLRRLFKEFQLNQPISEEPNIPATQIITDSTSAISLITKPSVSERNKHIDIKAHHIKEMNANGIDLFDPHTNVQHARRHTNQTCSKVYQRTISSLF